MFISSILIIIGFALLINGADFLINGASSIAKKFNIPEIIMGLTIVSIGTSMPELCVSLTSAIQNHSDMAIGNIIGSNITNLLLILGLSTIIRKIEFKRETKLIEIPMCICITVIFAILCNIGESLSRTDGIVLMFLCICFILYTIFIAIKNEKEQEKKEIKDKEKNRKISIDILYIIIGICALRFGGNIVVDNSMIIARNWGISEKIIGVTILAIGTSLPELFTSVTASIKNKSDIAIGNILGACTFNILLNMGLTSFISPIQYNLSYNVDISLLIIATILLGIFPFIRPKNTMSRMNGIIYVLMYVGYLMMLIYI